MGALLSIFAWVIWVSLRAERRQQGAPQRPHKALEMVQFVAPGD